MLFAFQNQDQSRYISRDDDDGEVTTNGSKSSGRVDINRNVNINDNYPNGTDATKHIKVKIGSIFAEYALNDLRQLSYFESMLSGKWSNTNAISTKTSTVEIFPTSFNHANSNGYGNYKCGFTCNDLTLLIECISNNNSNDIPIDKLLPKLELIESLLYCQDFFNPKQTFIKSRNTITQKSVWKDNSDEKAVKSKLNQDKAFLLLIIS